jgi:hypothetical protein
MSDYYQFKHLKLRGYYTNHQVSHSGNRFSINKYSFLLHIFEIGDRNIFWAAGA